MARPVAGRSARADRGQTTTEVMKSNPEPKPAVVEALVGLLAVLAFLAPKLAGAASASWRGCMTTVAEPAKSGAPHQGLCRTSGERSTPETGVPGRFFAFRQ